MHLNIRTQHYRHSELHRPSHIQECPTIIFEPEELTLPGSAPDIAGQGIANPVGTILSAAMMLRYSLGRGAEAALIEQAVSKMFDDGLRTKDLGGQSGTKEVGDRVVAELEALLAKK